MLTILMLNQGWWQEIYRAMNEGAINLTEGGFVPGTKG
jgi:hypothetical protein